MIPVINKPRKDELFSSWITRTAEENGLSISTFAKAYLGAKKRQWGLRITMQMPDFIPLLIIFFLNSRKKQVNYTGKLQLSTLNQCL